MPRLRSGTVFVLSLGLLFVALIVGAVAIAGAGWRRVLDRGLDVQGDPSLSTLLHIGESAPKGHRTIPKLVELLSHADVDVRFYSAVALLQIDTEVERAAPILVAGIGEFVEARKTYSQDGFVHLADERRRRRISPANARRVCTLLRERLGDDEGDLRVACGLLRKQDLRALTEACCDER